MPKLWNETVEAHRRDVRDAILNTTATLANERGVLAVTMSEIAEQTGIGRATLYKYFPDVEAILIACHERHVHEHLKELAAISQRPGSAPERLRAVLDRYATITFERHRSDVGALSHRKEHEAHAEQQLRSFLRDLLSVGAESSELRDDVPPDELAVYCLHALAAAGRLPSKAAVRRLVDVTFDALLPPKTGGDVS